MEEPRQSHSGLEFKLHPLVLLTISDHHTRVRANAPQPGGASSSSAPEAPPAPDRVVGCLLGQQTGRAVDISNSFELTHTTGPDGVATDDELLATKLDQYKQVFPKLDVVGWYTTGARTTEADMLLHRKVMGLNESPVLLVFNTKQDALRKDLPVMLYESELHVIDDRPTLTFVHSKYVVETSEAERIGVNQVAKVHPTGNPTGSDQLNAHLTATGSAVKMLAGRIHVLLQLLGKVQSGELPYDHQLVRDVNSLLHQLPAIQRPEFTNDFLREHSDAMLTVYLSSVTKGLQDLNEVVDKHAVSYERRLSRR